MLELKNISFTVTDEQSGSPKKILKDISLELKDQDFTVITGPNGGGKSTLAKIIMGIEQPSTGQILYQGEDITGLDVTERARRKIGYAFQQPVKFKGLYVRDLLRLAAGRELTHDEACHFLSEVGLCALDYVDREINGSLSGGELKRIEIATLLARGTRLAIFDEPEAGIDLWSFQSLIRIFERMRDEHQSTVLIISHQERILNIADTIVLLADGKIARIGDRADVMPELMVRADSCKDNCPELQQL